MTEAELHFLKQRLYHGRLNKARRGELFTMVPTGYVRLPGGGVASEQKTGVSPGRRECQIG